MKGVALVCSALAVVAIAAGPSPALATDDQDIQAVIESFRTAIIQRDKDRFLNLFVTTDLPWQGVLTDEGLAQLRRRDPKAAKVTIDRKSTPVAFIESVLRNKLGSEEKFSNIKIDTDGDVATVTLNYEFHSGLKIVNSGKECWLLVRTGAGWKITTLAFSSSLNKEDVKH